MSEPIRVAVSGAGGRMGREVVNTVMEAAPEFALTAAADPAYAGRSVSAALGLESDVLIEATLSDALETGKSNAVVIFSLPNVVMNDIEAAMSAGVVPVVGTTGITPERLDTIKAFSALHGVGAIIAPNFAIGAVLMMKLSAEVAKYMPAAEIIEYHHDKKLDAPSGTAAKTAEMMAAARPQGFNQAAGENVPARGGEFSGIQIHSVRMPGMIAHQEVIFGGVGQTLTIRHDSYDRKSFMPGVLMALRKANGLKEVIYGLENIL